MKKAVSRICDPYVCRNRLHFDVSRVFSVHTHGVSDWREEKLSGALADDVVRVCVVNFCNLF